MYDDYDDIEWRSVGSVDQWPQQGTARVVALGARRIAVLRGHNGWYAFKNSCPHRNLQIVPNGGEPTQLACDNGQVHCPHHGWPFELATGQGPEDNCLRTYPVREVDGSLEVGV